MGISFDLAVEDLPDGIFDKVVDGNFHKQDNYSKGRWDGISPLEGSWVVNDIQVANNIVLMCGSYEAIWDRNDVDIEIERTYEPDTVFSPFAFWRDGFFACVSFDEIDNLEAWHIVPTRSLLEMGPGITNSPVNFDEGGLQSFVIDYRTIGQGEPNPNATGQPIYVTAVGYTAVDGSDPSGYGFAAGNPVIYEPYKYSMFENQDFYPQMFSWVIENSSTAAEAKSSDNLYSAFPEAYLQGIKETGFQADQLGRSLHLNLYDTENGPMIEDWNNNSKIYYGCAIAPLEQYTYRAHQIGFVQLPVSGYFNTNPYGRNPNPLGWCPTSYYAVAPILKPIEFCFTVPGYKVEDGLGDPTGASFFPEAVRNLNRTVAGQNPDLASDALIWRHGWIPRKLLSIYRTQPVPSIYNPLAGSFPFQFGIFGELGTLVIGGDCLYQSYNARGEAIAGQATSDTTVFPPVLNYEPLLLYGQNGWAQGVSGVPTIQPWDVGVFFAFTKRNFTIEDVAPTAVSSLTNASIELIAPCQEILDPFRTSLYPVLLGIQITQPANRAEIMVFSPTESNASDYPTVFCQDWKVVGPYASTGGAWETATGLELGTTWNNVGSQPIDFTANELDLSKWVANYKRYGFINPQLVGVPVGRSNIFGGNTTRRTQQGTYALAYDIGSITTEFNSVWNTRTPATPNIEPSEGFRVLKVSERTDNTIGGTGPQEIDYFSSIQNTALTNQFYSQTIYHIPNSSMLYPNGTLPVSWDWRQFTTIDINGLGFGGLIPAATIPPPSGQYLSLQDLADQLNQELTYMKSAGAPFSLNTPNGVAGITFKVTSDNKGVYAEVDSALFTLNFFGNLSDPTNYGGRLSIRDPVGTFNNANNYPYTVDPFVGITYNWANVEYTPQAATVQPSTIGDASGCFQDIGKLLDDSTDTPIAVGSQRFFISADYDTDRDQWLIALGDLTNNYTVIASTTDFSELLDQTDSFEKVLLNRRQAMLLALNQKTDALDGVAFAGNYVAIHGVTNDFNGKAYKITGTTGRNVKVFLNYMLYDGLESLIAVEVANLGLSVTPENVMWYKTTIMNGNADEEVTLEEIENWMNLQREQYEGMLRNKKPVQRDDGSLPKVDDYILDDKSIEDLLPELDRLPPNPDSSPSDADMMGNTLSGDIKSIEEKRRETDV